MELLGRAPDPVSTARLTIAQITAALKPSRRHHAADNAQAIRAALGASTLPSRLPWQPGRAAGWSPDERAQGRAQIGRPGNTVALSLALAAPGASPRSRRVSKAHQPESSARLAAKIRPASATAWSSSKVTANGRFGTAILPGQRALVRHLKESPSPGPRWIPAYARSARDGRCGPTIRLAGPHARIRRDGSYTYTQGLGGMQAPRDAALGRLLPVGALQQGA